MKQVNTPKLYILLYYSVANKHINDNCQSMEAKH